MQPKRLLQLSFLAALPAAMVSTGQAVTYTAVWYDGFNTSANSTDINLENGFPRQGGIGIPTTWVSNSGPADYHAQVGFGALLLAGDAGLVPGTTIASPNLNFLGLTGGGEVIGTQISVNVDPGTVNATGRYTYTAITVASVSTLTASGSAGSNFSVRFIEDIAFGNGNFIQTYDGDTLVGNLIANPAGVNPMLVQLFFSDTDGNPWDGVGATTIDLSINGNAVPLASYTKGGGGYTSNNITLEGSMNFVTAGLETNFFDNLTVSSSPIPEPSAALLGGLGLLGLLRRRRA